MLTWDSNFPQPSAEYTDRDTLPLILTCLPFPSCNHNSFLGTEREDCLFEWTCTKRRACSVQTCYAPVDCNQMDTETPATREMKLYEESQCPLSRVHRTGKHCASIHDQSRSADATSDSPVSERCGNLRRSHRLGGAHFVGPGSRWHRSADDTRSTWSTGGWSESRWTCASSLIYTVERCMRWAVDSETYATDALLSVWPGNDHRWSSVWRDGAHLSSRWARLWRTNFVPSWDDAMLSRSLELVDMHTVLSLEPANNEPLQWSTHLLLRTS